MQVELEDQPAVTGQVDEQVHDTANIGYQEGLLLEEDTVEEQWRLCNNVMAAFNTIFQGYKNINEGFMTMSQLIDGTPLHAMGAILNDIQESAAKSAGYGGGIDEEEEGEAEEASEEVGRGKKKGREGAKRKKDRDNDDQKRKIRKRKTTPIKRETVDIQEDRFRKIRPIPRSDT